MLSSFMTISSSPSNYGLEDHKPVFGVTTAEDNLCHDLSWSRLGNGRVLDGDRRALADDCFLHDEQLCNG